MLTLLDESNKNEEDQCINPNTMLTLLDGQKCRLDTKYEQTFLKRVNVPIILIGNTLSRSFRDQNNPIAKKIIPLQFDFYHKDLDEGRIIVNLVGIYILKLVICS